VGTITANATAIRTRTVASPPNKRACVRERVSHIHGGLTPAALFGVRLCIAKIVFSLADVRIAMQERGA
jgi:hypothetical protein